MSSAKRMRLNPPAFASGARLNPELQFKELEIEQVQWTRRVEPEKFSAHADADHNLYVSDSSQIVCFRRDGSCRPVVADIEPHHIVPNSTADVVVILRKSDKQKLSKVTLDGTISTILETSGPLYGPDVCPNGDVVHHPSTNRLERKNSLGELTASIEGGRGRVISFDANSYLTSGQDGHVYFSSKTCVYRWNLLERNVECIAGHPKAPGRRDGFGTDARFTHLKRPVLTNRFAYVRESDNRFCRIDLETFEVTTLQLRGVERDAIETYGITPDGRMMFVISSLPFSIYTADTNDCLESTFQRDMRSVDWACSSGSRLVELVAGRDRRVFTADSRILQARSSYFRSMLTGGMREASSSSAIDLGEDVPGEALGVLLHFLHTDTFEPVPPPSRAPDLSDEEMWKTTKLSLEVHTLADRFLLPRLARLCEVFLSEAALRTSTVLPLLASITEQPRRFSLAGLESACWDFVEANWHDVRQHEASMRELLETRHPLLVELLQAADGLKRPSGSAAAAAGRKAVKQEPVTS